MPDPKVNNRFPEWTPASAGPEFAGRVMPGKNEPDASPSSRASSMRRRPRFDREELAGGILAGNRALLSRAITLVESNRAEHQELAQLLLADILPQTGQSTRIGITGIPGVGKSTFIEALGCLLCENEYRVAVLAVDPSSALSSGSILGDKTRMEKLSRHPNAFIRPSPSGGNLGGVARKTRETLLICEAAGYDFILVETMGVGQGEFVVRSMVDMFLLLTIAGAGDELQGIKKGIMELADAILVNKADGANLPQARAKQSEFSRILPILQPATAGWKTRVLACSALEGTGLEEVITLIDEFRKSMQMSGAWEERRHEQRVGWLRSLLEDRLRQLFYQHPEVKKKLTGIEQQVREGRLPVGSAVEQLMSIASKAITESLP